MYAQVVGESRFRRVQEEESIPKLYLERRFCQKHASIMFFGVMGTLHLLVCSFYLYPHLNDFFFLEHQKWHVSVNFWS